MKQISFSELMKLPFGKFWVKAFFSASPIQTSFTGL